MLYVYGEYLLHGGSKEQFRRLTMEDIQIMAAVALAGRRRTAGCIADAVAGLFKVRQ